MREYVLPDFSSIKKGFCKVSRCITVCEYCNSILVTLFLIMKNKNAILAFVLFILYVLQPREEMNFTGKYKTGEQILRLTNERFAVPEMLFHPSDIGIQEMGIPEALVNSINNMPEGRLPLI